MISNCPCANDRHDACTGCPCQHREPVVQASSVDEQPPEE